MVAHWVKVIVDGSTCMCVCAGRRGLSFHLKPSNIPRGGVPEGFVTGPLFLCMIAFYFLSQPRGVSILLNPFLKIVVAAAMLQFSLVFGW